MTRRFPANLGTLNLLAGHRDRHNRHLDVVLSYLVTHVPHDVATTSRR
jgi:hypothetical protein